jgi:hypothetical protein
MRSRACTAIAMAIALLALPAIATGDTPEPGSAVAELGPKNYAKNSASGDYAGGRSEAEAALIKRGLALNQAAQASDLTGAAQAPRPAGDDGFAWNDAAVGAGVALALSAALASLLFVRRRIAAGGAQPARSWGS